MKPTSFRTGCGHCGREVHEIVDERGERWVHTVEPTGHEAAPNDDVALGRARVIDELRRQLDFQKANGAEPSWSLIEDWTDWFSRSELLTTPEQDSAAYRKALRP